MHQTSKLNRLIASANAVIDTRGTIRTNGKPASLRTVKLTREALNSTCRRYTRWVFMSRTSMD